MSTGTVALLVIDMQVGSFTGPDAHPGGDAAVERINALAAAVRAAGGIVVFIQHDGKAGDGYESGRPGWALLPGLSLLPGDSIVHKRTCDSFYQTDLADLLSRHGARRLLVTGDASDFCVDSTVRAAASREYEITVVEDGHTCGNRPHLPARAVIEHHNFVWRDLILPSGQIDVTPAAELIARLERP